MERDGISWVWICLFWISTHTLTWSVTHLLWLQQVLYTFQLTRSRGAWPSMCIGLTSTSLFQLTRSRGAWLKLIQKRNHIPKFQLTRSRGAWPLCNIFCDIERKFQLTRSRGAWQSTMTTWCYRCKFQLTRSRGAWQNVFCYQGKDYCISTHTLTWSVTSGVGHNIIIGLHFNSHAHVERDGRNRG